MRIEFKGATLVLDGYNGAFSLTVGGESVTFAPQGPVSDKVDNTAHFYVLQFSPHTVWNNVRSGGKIPAIKAVRQLTGCGLGEAKAIVEGTTTYIEGPMWDKSEFKRALDDVARGTYSVTPCERWHVTSPMKFT